MTWRWVRSVPSDRGGVSAVEVVISLVLFAFVVHGTWRVFAAQRLAANALMTRTEVLDASRISRVVLGAEVGAGLPGRDWYLPSPGILDLRAFRGWGAVCPSMGEVTEIVVAYRGLRSPDPEKDSVLILGSSSSWEAVGLAGRAVLEEGCPSAKGRVPGSGSRLERWTLDRSVVGPVVARLFERGRYHLTDGALRYQRGAAGRQPLTATVLDPVESGLEPLRGGVAVRLTTRGREAAAEVQLRILLGNEGVKR